MMTKKVQFIGYVFFVIVLFLYAYANHFNNTFHFDDFHTVVYNPYIKDLKNIPLFFKDGTTFSTLPANQSYRPIVTMSLAIDYYLSKDGSPFYFHLSTYILYALQSVLLFFMFLKIADEFYKNEHNRWFALIASAFYTLHTANAETINYIIARGDIQSTFFVVLGIVVYQYLPKLRKYYLYMLPVIIGILSKPPAIVFLPIILMYDLLIEQKLFSIKGVMNFNVLKKLFIKLIPVMVITAVMYKFVTVMIPSTFVPGGKNAVLYIATQPIVILHYIQMFFLPTALSADTDWKLVSSLSDSKVFIGIAFLVALLFLIYKCFRSEKYKPVAFGLGWFLVALAPTSLVPLAEVMNDHRIFFPYIGLTLSVTWLVYIWYIEKIATKNFQFAFGVIVSAILIAHTFGVRARNVVWKTEESLWKDVTEKSPKNGRGLMNYGLVLMGKGQYTESMNYFDKGLQLMPYYSYLHINKAICLNALNRPKEAEEHYKVAMIYDPQNPASYSYYAQFLKNYGRNYEAIPLLQKALQLSFANNIARNLLLEIYYLNSQINELKATIADAFKIDPKDPAALYYQQALQTIATNNLSKEQALLASPSHDNYINLSLLYYNQGKFEACIEACKKALALNPQSAEAYNNMCCSYNNLKQWKNAIETGEKALALKPDFQLAKNNLSYAKSQLK